MQLEAWKYIYIEVNKKIPSKHYLDKGSNHKIYDTQYWNGNPLVLESWSL